MIGSVLAGRYAIVRQIGRGGVGVVYLASDRESSEDVVVKALAQDWSTDAEALARFDREVERLGGLEHANIVKLLDFGHERGRAYMVLEYVPGITLHDYLRAHGPLEVEVFVPIAAQILKGIGYAHARGLVHRDLKPENIMLCEHRGRGNFVKVLDFGLARMVEGERQITRQELVGTAGFLAPEQIRSHTFDSRADIYALGVLFYLMLSGNMPFGDAHSAALLYKNVHERPTPLEEVLPEGVRIPGGLVALIHDCLAKDPASRPQTAEIMIERVIGCVPEGLFRLPMADDPRTAHRVLEGSGASVEVEVSLEESVDDSLSDAETRAVTAIDADADLRTAVYMAQPEPAKAARGRGRRARRARGLRGPVAADANSGAQRSSSARARVIVNAPPVAAMPPSRGNWLLVGGLAAVLGGGVFAYTVYEPNEAEVAGVEDGDSLAETLDKAARHVEHGDFRDAQGVLDDLRYSLEARPRLRVRADRLRARVQVGLRLETARKLEASGDPLAARRNYRDVLAIDPSNRVARERLASLDANATGTVEIRSEPAADVEIDGEIVGRTPFTATLSVGGHAIRLIAAGYEPHGEVVEVGSFAQMQVDVVLDRRGAARRAGPRPGDRPSSPPVGTGRQVESPPSPVKKGVDAPSGPEPAAEVPDEAPPIEDEIPLEGEGKSGKEKRKKSGAARDAAPKPTGDPLAADKPAGSGVFLPPGGRS